jgi:muramoyltetrapeptide carboxypeptidase LdcA involved in peptidoglycan recycling
MIKPPKLQVGDKVAAVTLSWGGPGTYPHRYQAGVKQLQAEFDLHVIPMKHTLKDADWLCRNPQARAEDLMAAFSDPCIKGIISTIGGEDSIRMVPYLDFEIIRGNPKVFLGYSDTTISHLACYQAELVSFYGPAIMAGFAENRGLFPYMIESLRRTLFSSKPIGEVEANTQGWTVETLDWADPNNQMRRRQLQPSTGWKFVNGDGVARGPLIGGCIEVIDWLRGHDLFPTLDQWEGAILFLETSEEAPPPSQVKYILRCFAALGILERLSGVLFGRPGGGCRRINSLNMMMPSCMCCAMSRGLIRCRW